MQGPWTVGVVLAGALALCPAVESAEQISAKLLEEAKAKAVIIERLISDAKEGDAQSQFLLGIMVAKDGREYVKKIAEKTNTSSEAAIREVQDASVEWLLRAAYQDHEGAQWLLSVYYEDFDIVKAYAWNRLLFRKNGRDGISNRNGIKKPQGKWLLAEMTADQVAEAKRLSREIERKIKQIDQVRE